MIKDERLEIVNVDDDPLFLDIVTGIISAKTKFVVHKETTGEGLIALLDRQKIDCIVLDYDLGNDNGFSIMQRVGERFSTVPPVVMLTGDGREITAVRAMRLGIDDYVMKRAMTPGELIGAITRVVENDRKERAERIEFERLKAAAALDMVTGTLGRTALDERLALLAALRPEIRAHHALVLVELVQLNEIREKFGLKAGDRALREFALRLQQTIRSNDICGRYGGDAFLVIGNVKGDRAALEVFCARLAALCATKLDLETGSVSIAARVGGAICAFAGRERALAPAELVEPAWSALKNAAASDLSYAMAPPHDVASAAAPVAAVQAAAPEGAVKAEALPSADQLRTVDRRREWRQRVFKRAQIIDPDKNTSINCMVRNLSASGAGLRIDVAFPVPDSFELEIFGSGVRRKARLRWQTGVDLGVEFVER